MAGMPAQGWASALGLLPLPPRQPVTDNQIAQKLAIGELFARYGIAHDEVDETAMAELFTPDAVLEVSLAGPVFERHEGRDAISGNFARVAATQTDQRRHAVSNIDVTPTSDTSATARAYGIVTAADETGLRIAVSCAYTADLTFCTDGLWRFARLWIGMDHYAGNAPKMHT